MWSLIVNLCKTKIVVFRRGCKLKRSEKWYFNGKKMDVVSSYKYLGIIFSTKLKWTLAKKTLAAQARKAIGLIFKYHYQSGYLPVGVAKILFDKMITPILLYGCEVWGWEYCDQIEKLTILLLQTNIRSWLTHFAYCCYRRAWYIPPSQ